MLIIEIRSRDGAPTLDGRPQGVIGELPYQDGTHRLTTGDEVIVEVNPPEATEGLMVIALTSALFEGHQRGAGYRGKQRRVVQIGRKGIGSTQLSSYEVLNVTVEKT